MIAKAKDIFGIPKVVEPGKPQSYSYSRVALHRARHVTNGKNMLPRNRHTFRARFPTDLSVTEDKCDINSAFDKKLIEPCFTACTYTHKKMKGQG